MSKYPQDQPEEANKANVAEARKEPAKNDHSPKSTLSPTPGVDAEWAAHG